MPLFPLQVEEVVIQNLPPFGMKTTFNHLRSEQPHIVASRVCYCKTVMNITSPAPSVGYMRGLKPQCFLATWSCHTGCELFWEMKSSWWRMSECSLGNKCLYVLICCDYSLIMFYVWNSWGELVWFSHISRIKKKKNQPLTLSDILNLIFLDLGLSFKFQFNSHLRWL